MKRLSFADAMFTVGGYMVLGCGLVLSAIIYFAINPVLGYGQLISAVSFIVLYPIMLEIYRETINERIKKGDITKA